ncbi:hypothetical protein FA13DRAFT_146200 [Coprinellus micaceus]|uniref:Uncharacterized protein n=1 Tax=Coprinellus micaceus TaxID=71717 RepID=A0A4Y7SHH7_COPMI|nr:hypothetical protein FA13DRAFT_146200 [Coprinellus micaceus]
MARDSKMHVGSKPKAPWVYCDTDANSNPQKGHLLAKRRWKAIAHRLCAASPGSPRKDSLRANRGVVSPFPMSSGSGWSPTIITKRPSHFSDSFGDGPTKVPSARWNKVHDLCLTPCSANRFFLSKIADWARLPLK